MFTAWSTRPGAQSEHVAKLADDPSIPEKTPIVTELTVSMQKRFTARNKLWTKPSVPTVVSLNSRLMEMSNNQNKNTYLPSIQFLLFKVFIDSQTLHFRAKKDFKRLTAKQVWVRFELFPQGSYFRSLLQLQVTHFWTSQIHKANKIFQKLKLLIAWIKIHKPEQNAKQIEIMTLADAS